MSMLRFFFACLLVIFAASCTYQGKGSDPITKKFTWFSYVNGDDIRKACANLGADRYRFVYNGVYQHQTRTYDVFFHAKKIVMHVAGAANVKKLDLHDLLAPWRGVREELVVGDKELSQIKRALGASAALQPTKTGLRLYSDKFYWTVAACVEGKMHFNAYAWPSTEWETMQFDDVLLALDVTSVPVEEPRVLTDIDIWGSSQEADPFLIELGDNGLVGFEGGSVK
ncbi:conserved exported hypothetical protein [Candidatus Terasakiella magnetica]|uniref:Lipoprotein n=1 Tax=Candidatus Terasakiella magnetica TaxID=1867952 RepID=A0A1C3RDA5_9PROT|nr:hypothetical protein [Candidatus Terasakiella magnetica]SCA55211.1 conserved exported hypothetical protein [Candidatus Terasakiella magnetica]